MAEGQSAARRVLELKEQLGCPLEPEEIIKKLKVLQDLDMSLDILVETGIGKTVNSFRKHATAGNVAKALVKQWKKLIPPENKSGYRGRKQNTEKEREKTKSSIFEEIKPSEKSKASVLASRSSNRTSTSKKLNKQHACHEKTHQSKDCQSHKEYNNEECSSSGSKHDSQGTNPQAEKSDLKERASSDSKKVSEEQHFSVADKDVAVKEEPSKDASKQRNPKRVKEPQQKLSKSKPEISSDDKPQQKLSKSKPEISSDEEFEPPTMSFESYLTYDQVTIKRKRKKACSKGELPKKCSKQKKSSLPQKISTCSPAKQIEEDKTRCERDQSETPNKKAKVASLQDLLNTPLPKFLTGISISSPPYEADFKASLAPVVEEPQPVSDVVQFTGRRLNSKMQVYSGSKTVCLSKMLTLYEQCIRVLQNNIDSLHEVGGVPFAILEPVLKCCTPEQLFRIEECNTTFTEESDHLWKKHCQRDFKNESHLECESWREMYLRLFNQREEKLKMLTKNILSAQSEKPKGRKVKMAYMTSAAKPPRDIRRQQEIHGTAGPVTQFHPIVKCKTNILESRDRNNTSNAIPVSTSGNCSSSIMTPDGKKTIKKEIAPIMRKTLKALKSRAGRR